MVFCGKMLFREVNLCYYKSIGRKNRRTAAFWCGFPGRDCGWFGGVDLRSTKNDTFLSRERFAQEEITRGLERAGLEDKLLRLYDSYWETGNSDVLQDLILNAERLMANSVSSKLSGSNCIYADAEDALQEISLQFSDLLVQDRKNGIRRENIVHTIRALYCNRALDILGKLQRSAHGIFPDSLERINTDPDGKTRERVGRGDEITDEEHRMAVEKGSLSARLLRIYLSVMMDYRREPQKPVGLCYARILYQLERLFSPQEIQRAGELLALRDKRKKTSSFEKMVDAYADVQKPATATSLAWAKERMGKKKLVQLVFEAQDSIQTHFDETLCWSSAYLARLREPSTCPGGILWRDVVYTEEYTSAQTSNWAESIHKSIFHTSLDIIQADPELMDEVMRLDLPFKARMLQAGKGKKQ